MGPLHPLRGRRYSSTFTGWREVPWYLPRQSAEGKDVDSCLGDEVTLGVDLGLGKGKSTVYTCDLTAQYIAINADYRS